jgi:hypothetical protein
MSEMDRESGESFKSTPDGTGAGEHGIPVGCVPDPNAPHMSPPLPACSQAETAIAFSQEEYEGVLKRPQQAIEYILGSSSRLVRSVWEGEAPWRLAIMLLAASLLTSIPYGIVSPHGDWWKIAVLYCGSLAICFPSLHIFAQFFGVKLKLMRSLSLSMIITATAAIFTFGFSPIIWFLDKTIKPSEQTVIRPDQLSTFLLYVSLALGLVQVGRCLSDPGFRRAHRNLSLGFLFILWAPLLIFITHRMACLLELL